MQIQLRTEGSPARVLKLVVEGKFKIKQKEKQRYKGSNKKKKLTGFITFHISVSEMGKTSSLEVHDLNR